ncbi:MAG: hypothetical protein U0R44_02565 [Candidatus Micrarchaeia archaeon]
MKYAEDEESIKEVRNMLDSLLTIGIDLGAGKVEEGSEVTESGRKINMSRKTLPLPSI